ncbi:MFS transporter [Brevibacillus fluminis]|uniref:MFS transporter n=1 Tax=Brevibacillus fluminis TaxID=511487 RepID=UPI00319E8C12
MTIVNRLFIYLLTTGVFLTATSELIIAGILTAIADDLHISLGAAGQLITSYSLAFAIGTPIVVTLTSRIGQKRVLTGALIVFIAGSLVAFASAHYWLLLLSRLILGVSSGVFLVVTFSSVAKLVPTEKTGSAIGTVILGFSSAMIVGVPIGIAITASFSWQTIFLLLALFSLLILFTLIRYLPDIEGDAPVSFRQQIRLLGNPIIIGGLFLTFFRETGTSIMYTYLTPFLQTILHLKTAEIGMTILALGVFGVIGSRLGGSLVDKWGASRLIFAGLAVHAASVSLLPAFTASVAIDLALIAVMVFAMFATAPAIQTFYIQLAPQSANLLLGINTSVVHVGLAVGAGMGGLLANETSTVLYNPWLAGMLVALGFAAAVGTVSIRKKAALASQARS